MSVLLENVFSIRHLVTRIEDAYSVRLQDSPSEVVDQMRNQRFDQAPVVNGGLPVGWVALKDLISASKVKSAYRPLADTTVVSVEAPVGAALAGLSKGFVFAAGDSGIDSFAVPSDLEKQAGRGYFYLLVSRVEMLLSEIVDSDCDRDAVVARVEASDETARRWREDLAAGREAPPVEYLYIRDLAELYQEVHAVGRNIKDALVRLCQFRPSVMHPTKSLIGNRDIRELKALVEDAGGVTAELRKVLASGAME